MKRLIAVASCRRRAYKDFMSAQYHKNGANSNPDWLMATWMGQWEDQHLDAIDAHIFYGRNEDKAPMNVVSVSLPCGDSYHELYEKVREIFRWALARGYDYVFKCDDDCFIRVDRLLAHFKPCTYRGTPVFGDNATYAAGFGYWIGARAMRIVVDSPLPPEEIREYEDRAVGWTLRQAGIEVEDVSPEEFVNCCCDACRWRFANAVTVHVEQPHYREQILKEGTLAPATLAL